MNIKHTNKYTVHKQHINRETKHFSTVRRQPQTGSISFLNLVESRVLGGHWCSPFAGFICGTVKKGSHDYKPPIAETRKEECLKI